MSKPELSTEFSRKINPGNLRVAAFRLSSSYLLDFKTQLVYFYLKTLFLLLTSWSHTSYLERVSVISFLAQKWIRYYNIIVHVGSPGLVINVNYRSVHFQ